MTKFVVLVEFLRSDGNFRSLDSRDPRFDFSEVEVMADTEADAHLLACQMVACRTGIMPTRSLPSC